MKKVKLLQDKFVVTPGSEERYKEIVTILATIDPDQRPGLEFWLDNYYDDISLHFNNNSTVTNIDFITLQHSHTQFYKDHPNYGEIYTYEQFYQYIYEDNVIETIVSNLEKLESKFK